MQPGVQALCHKAAQNVRLVCAGGGNQQVCVCGARLAQRAQRRGVARHGQKVIFFQAAAQHAAVGINHHQLVPLVQQLARQRKAHLSIARNDDFHVQGPLSAAAGMPPRRMFFLRAARPLGGAGGARRVGVATPLYSFL